MSRSRRKYRSGQRGSSLLEYVIGICCLSMLVIAPALSVGERVETSLNQVEFGGGTESTMPDQGGPPPNIEPGGDDGGTGRNGPGNVGNGGG